jgi:hypothetical protein
MNRNAAATFLVVTAMAVVPGSAWAKGPGDHGSFAPARAEVSFPGDGDPGGAGVAKVRFRGQHGEPAPGEIARIRLTERSTGRSRDFYGQPSQEDGISFVPLEYPRRGEWEWALFAQNGMDAAATGRLDLASDGGMDGWLVGGAGGLALGLLLGAGGMRLGRR